MSVKPLSAPTSNSSGIFAKRSGTFGRSSFDGFGVSEANWLPNQLSNFRRSSVATSKKYDSRHLLNCPLSYKMCNL